MPTSPDGPVAGLPVVIRASFEIVDATLHLPFSVENSGEESVEVRLVATNRRFDPIPLEPFICYRLQDQALHLLAGQPPTSSGRDVFAPATALSRTVEPGERVEHRYEIPTPVEEWNPHGMLSPWEEEPEPRAVVAYRVQLSLEWFRSVDAQARDRRDDYPEGFYRAVGVPVRVASVVLEAPKGIPALMKAREYPRF